MKMVQNQKLSDKEVSFAMLNTHKLQASSLTNLVLESSSDAVRRDAVQILQRTFQHQKMIWDYMNQKGFYQVEAAPQQDITKVQQQMQQSMGMQ